ncbi:MAG: DoxX-like family protein [Thermoanaerobaculia bacterium]
METTRPAVPSSGRLTPGPIPSWRPRALMLVRYGIASIWLFHGVYGKLLGGIPRHQQIVARVVGASLAGAATRTIGLAEIVIALWFLTGKKPRWCAAAQTMMLAGMNAFELTHANDLLLAPVWMVGANACIAALAWWVASTDERAR